MRDTEYKNPAQVHVGDIVKVVMRTPAPTGQKVMLVTDAFPQRNRTTRQTELVFKGLALEASGNGWVRSDDDTSRTLPLASQTPVLGRMTDMAVTFPESYGVALEHLVPRAGKVAIEGKYYTFGRGSLVNLRSASGLDAFRIREMSAGLKLQASIMGGNVYRDIEDFNVTFKAADGQNVHICHERGYVGGAAASEFIQPRRRPALADAVVADPSPQMPLFGNLPHIPLLPFAQSRRG